MYFSRKQGASAPGLAISPRLAGIAVVVGVMAIPDIPAAYLTPPAVFFGAVTIFLMESRRYRKNRPDDTMVNKAAKMNRKDEA